MEAVTKERLEMLIGFMESLPEEAAGHFNMRHWVTHSDDSHSHFSGSEKLTQEKLLTCGTAACALGWATAMPYFQDLGLHAVIDDDDVAMYFGDRTIGADDTSPLFELTEEQSWKLFGPLNRDKSPKEWAARARGLIAEWESETV